MDKPLSEYIVDDARSVHVGFIHAKWVKEYLKELKGKSNTLKQGRAEDGSKMVLISHTDIDNLFGEFK